MTSRSDHLEFTVPGEPFVQPRGKPVFAGGDKRRGVRMVSAHADHPVWAWRQRIVFEARQAIAAKMGGALRSPPLFEGAVFLSVLFVTPFTGTARKKGNNPRRWHDARKDLDNFLKPLKDSLVEAGVMADDGQIVCYGRVAKVRAAHGEQPHTVVRIEPAGEIAEVWA